MIDPTICSVCKDNKLACYWHSSTKTFICSPCWDHVQEVLLSQEQDAWDQMVNAI